ncbi:MAG: AraC family transcriptional regulator [Syntrophaceae bacterium]
MTKGLNLKSRASIPVYRPINVLAATVHIAWRYGINAETLLSGSGIDSADVRNPHKIITTQQELAIYRRFQELVPVPGIGLELGRSFDVCDTGKLGVAALCCENFLEAIHLVVSYLDLSSSFVQYQVWSEGHAVYSTLHELINDHDIRQMVFDIELASLYTIASFALENTTVFKELHIACAPPIYAERYEQIFRCPVRFNAPRHLIVMDAGLLMKPMKMANPLVKKMLSDECEQLYSRLRDEQSLADKLRHEISLGESPYPTLELLASRINLSPRTIRRRLAQQGTSYKDILNDARLKQALHLIQSTDLSIEQIAFKLGYHDASNFCHAFKTWFGHTPGSLRKSGQK